MASAHLSVADLEPAATAVIDAYLDRLADQLPAPARVRSRILAELRDDLVDATTARLPESADPEVAARAAVAGFGDAATVAAAFRPELAARSARRFGLILLGTGPLIGVGWVSALAGSAATPARWWPLLLALPLLLLGAPAAVLTVAVTGRLARWLSPGNRPRAGSGPAALASGTVAGSAAVGADVVMLAGFGVVLAGSGLEPALPLAFAAVASLVRLSFVLLAAPKILKLS